MKRAFHSLILLACVAALLASCEMLPEADNPPLVEDLPSMEEVADSLNAMNAGSIKWVVQDGEVKYVTVNNVDWKREFKAFTRDNVNRLRFKDAYTVTDSTISGIRSVRFHANDNAQEVQSMEYEINRGRLVGFHIEKSRNNLLSTSSQSFHYNDGSYTLAVTQHIPWLFDNDQYVSGTIVPHGEVWLAEFFMAAATMPLQCIVSEQGLVVKNGDELVSFERTDNASDSMLFVSRHFRSHFRLSSVSDSLWEGEWVNEKHGTSRSIPVRFTRGVAHRFKVHRTPTHRVEGKHRMVFLNEDGSPEDTSLLVLHQDRHELQGSILTETGDYRWLDGVVRNDSIFLSTMDGTHAYLIQGVVEDSLLRGTFHAGPTYQQSWVAFMNAPVALQSPETMTRLKPGAEFAFAFPDPEGNLVSLGDERFQNKVVLVTVMGTWCSNCLDETLFLKEVSERYSNEDLEVVGLAFELIGDTVRSFENIRKHRKSLDIPYPVLLASTTAGKAAAAEKLPSLNGIYSYPTLIVLDRNHDVVKIHTGFSGPATGPEYYDAFKESYLSLLDQLVGK